MTLELRRWYAMLVVHSSGLVEASPIWVTGLETTRKGKGQPKLQLQFWHANYPEGVQDKQYSLRLMRHESGYLLARRLDPSSKQTILITEITPEWHRTHFGVTPAGDIQRWLDQNWGHP